MFWKYFVPLSHYLCEPFAVWIPFLPIGFDSPCVFLLWLSVPDVMEINITINQRNFSYVHVAFHECIWILQFFPLIYGNVMIAVGRATLEGMTKWGNYNWSGNAFHLLSPVLILVKLFILKWENIHRKKDIFCDLSHCLQCWMCSDEDH